MKNDFESVSAIASHYLREDSAQQIEEMKSFSNWRETLLSTWTLRRFWRLPTRNDLALNYLARHRDDYRRRHPLRLPAPSALSAAPRAA